MSCPDCASGEFLPGEPTGVLSTQGAYLAAGATQPSKRAVVLLTDVFGLPLKNCKIVADHLAKELDCDVWVPDMFAGRPIFPLSKMKSLEHMVEASPSIFDWFHFIFVDVLPNIPAFISSRGSVVDARVSAFVKVVQEEKKYEKIGSVGYCYGGSAAMRLGTTDVFQSVAIFHPGPFTVEQAKSIKVPAFWGWAAVDRAVTPALMKQTEEMYASRQGTVEFIDNEFQTYEGTNHGFAIRPNLSKPEVKTAYGDALKHTITWFNKTLAV
ncbi:hypothetical protein H0H92_003744 [Tricholoma furcatifolium]|nr:hypothetical protein H0H92_003744 [Tricholoma furcatifolium]